MKKKKRKHYGVTKKCRRNAKKDDTAKYWATLCANAPWRPLE